MEVMVRGVELERDWFAGCQSIENRTRMMKKIING